MKTSSEKEKKLDSVLSKLIKLNLNTNLKENLQRLSYQKNQLEIEKKKFLTNMKNLLKSTKKLSKS